MQDADQGKDQGWLNAVVTACSDGWRVLRHRGPGQIQFWLIALFIGVAAGLVAVAFRAGIDWLQSVLYGAPDTRALHSFAETLPWYWLLVLPIIGGLVVGQILHRFTDDGRVRSVAEVIEGAALNNGRVERRAGLASAVASLITLSSGGSTGREGPVVHLAGVVATWVSERINADGITGRDLLGCAVAAAVSASFNAPIAGALFALEVVLRHFAVHAFAPIVIASVAGTVVSRITLGDVTEFSLNQMNALAFYVELPAYLILGLVCGIVAVLLMRSVFWTDGVVSTVQHRFGIHRSLRPAAAGALLGSIAIFYPHIIGVGYETTSLALTNSLFLWEAIVFCAVKGIAVVITIAGRMGGGIFSPSLMMGALTGLAFGLVATAVFPNVSGSETLYALAGMGAVAAAVLGAPISTTLIVFELTGDWRAGIAVMVAVSISTAFASKLVHRSFFLSQIERKGKHIAAGPQAYLLEMFRASHVMRPIEELDAAQIALLKTARLQGHVIERRSTLENALPLFDKSGWTVLPVVDPGDPSDVGIKGALYQVDALKTYNKALAATAAEEHS